MPDAAAASVVMLALWLRKNGRRGWVPALVLACLFRETSVLAAAAVALPEFREKGPRSAVAAVVAPVLALLAWRLWVESRPRIEWLAGTHNLTLPFAGWWTKLAAQWPLPIHELLLVGAVAAGSPPSPSPGRSRPRRAPPSAPSWSWASASATT